MLYWRWRADYYECAFNTRTLALRQTWLFVVEKVSSLLRHTAIGKTEAQLVRRMKVPNQSAIWLADLLAEMFPTLEIQRYGSRHHAAGALKKVKLTFEQYSRVFGLKYAQRGDYAWAEIYQPTVCICLNIHACH